MATSTSNRRKPRGYSTLQLTLGISVALHAALLGVRLVDPQRFDRIFQDAPLEVILVNSKSAEAPEKATAIAQASLTGGGDLDVGRSTSPLPPSPQKTEGDAEEDDAQQQIAALQLQQMQLLLQSKNTLATLPPPDTSPAAATPAQVEHEERRRKLIELIAEIEKRISEDNARPRKRTIGPSTREAVYAVYYDTLRRKIEGRGTVNFPRSGGKKLYGQLTMALTVNFDGTVLETDVVKGSGNPALDRQAQAIVRTTGPFERFSPAMQAQADQIVVESSFNFTRDDNLETRLSGR